MYYNGLFFKNNLLAKKLRNKTSLPECRLCCNLGLKVLAGLHDFRKDLILVLLSLYSAPNPASLPLSPNNLQIMDTKYLMLPSFCS